MYVLINFLKENLEKNSYIITYCDIDESFGEFAGIDFHKQSKKYTLSYFENMGATSYTIKFDQIDPELEAEFHIIKETLSANGYDLERYGDIKDKGKGMIFLYKKGSQYYDLELDKAKDK